MRIGIFAPFTHPFATRPYLTAFARSAEERDFSSLWLGEHVVLFEEYASRYPYAADGRIPAAPENGMLEPFTALAFLAALTERIRLGTGICLVPQRNPVYTAKEVAAVDWLSAGRFDFGVGVGWLAEEFQALGVPFERRGARCREYVEVMRKLWTGAPARHEGPFYELPTCVQTPPPVQRPHPPIHFGGESDAALARVADLGQGWLPIGLSPDDLARRVRELERLLAARGRGLGELEITACPYLSGVDLDAIRRFRDAGATQVIVLVFAPSADDLVPVLDAVAESLVVPAAAL